jgi:hypothetical protein
MYFKNALSYVLQHYATEDWLVTLVTLVSSLVLSSSTTHPNPPSLPNYDDHAVFVIMPLQTKILLAGKHFWVDSS